MLFSKNIVGSVSREIFVNARWNKLAVKQMNDNSSAATEQIFKIFSRNVRSSVRASVGHACNSLLPSTIPVQCRERAWRWTRRLMHGFRSSPLVYQASQIEAPDFTFLYATENIGASEPIVGEQISHTFTFPQINND